MSICAHQDTQENPEREGTQGTGARLALGVHGETWDPWVQSLTWSTSKEAAGGQWWENKLMQELSHLLCPQKFLSLVPTGASTSGHQSSVWKLGGHIFNVSASHLFYLFIHCEVCMKKGGMSGGGEVVSVYLKHWFYFFANLWEKLQHLIPPHVIQDLPLELLQCHLCFYIGMEHHLMYEKWMNKCLSPHICFIIHTGTPWGNGKRWTKGHFDISLFSSCVLWILVFMCVLCVLCVCIVWRCTVAI